MKKVYIIIKNKSEDYHGIYTEIVAVFSEKEAAINKVKELQEDENNCNVEYDYEIYNVE